MAPYKFESILFFKEIKRGEKARALLVMWMKGSTTCTCTQTLLLLEYINTDGFHDLHNGYVDFATMDIRSVDPRRSVHFLL
jgi:hypothetical protein